LRGIRSIRKHKPVDIAGARIRKGAVVHIVGVPDLSGMSAGGIKESLPIFRYLVGKYKRVAGFNPYGFVELSFRIRKGRNRGWHSVEIEPFHLRIRRSRRA
jgi:hypothetical protein